MIIYRITNLANNKVYIGKTNNFKRRSREHAQASKIEETKLYRAIRKYGLECFKFEELFHVLPNFELSIEEIEKFFVEEYNSYKCGYNSTPGGQCNTNYADADYKFKSGSAFRGKKLSEEHKKKIGLSNIGKHTRPGLTNPNASTEIFEFKNHKTQEEFRGTRYEFVTKYSIKNHGNISSLISGKLKTAYGWVLISRTQP